MAGSVTKSIDSRERERRMTAVPVIAIVAAAATAAAAAAAIGRLVSSVQAVHRTIEQQRPVLWTHGTARVENTHDDRERRLSAHFICVLPAAHGQ